jgi:hypothetical protein
MQNLLLLAAEDELLLLQLLQHRAADSDNSESNLLKAAEYSPTDLNAKEMFH